MSISQVRAINCTQCGAGLSVLGGGRVRVHVCSYCGSALDTSDAYRVLERYDRMPRPESPFKLGMSGKIQGVEYTVIGTLGMREDGGWASVEWVEHQLYSPTHGYAWLNYEVGHTTFTRKKRALPTPSWMGKHSVAKVQRQGRSRPVCQLAGEEFAYYECSSATPFFIEGEFNWLPTLKDTRDSVSLLSDTGMLSYVSGRNEREIEVTRWLPAKETLEAFQCSNPENSRWVHPIQPYNRWPHEQFFSKVAGLAFAFLCLVWLYSYILPVVTLDRQYIELNRLPQKTEFNISHTQHLVELTLRAEIKNTWLWTRFEIYDPDEQLLFSAQREISYYAGYDGGERWEEGSRAVEVTFKPTRAGKYVIAFDEYESERGDLENNSIVMKRLFLSVRERVFATHWLYWGLALLGGALLFLYWCWYQHEKSRWAGSDWEEDD